METEAPCSTWRRTSGAAPEAVKAARPVLNGGREETCRKVTRLAPTQLESSMKVWPSPSSHENTPMGYFRGNVK
jgi:hypothetical protein